MRYFTICLLALMLTPSAGHCAKAAGPKQWDVKTAEQLIAAAPIGWTCGWLEAQSQPLQRL